MKTTHPDDESLSAALDGEDDDAAAHTQMCSECEIRMARLQDAAEAVATPVVPADAGARDAALNHALRRAGSPHPRPRRWVGPVSVAAAALVLGGVVVARRSSSGSGTPLANPSAGSRPNVTNHLIDGGDLGDLADQRALAALVRQQLTAGSGSGAGGAAATFGPRNGGPAAAVPSAPGPAVVAAGGENAAPRGATSASCRSAANSLGADRLGQLGYVAVLRWQGTPAELLGFRATFGRGLREHLFVMTRPGCQLLFVQSF